MADLILANSEKIAKFAKITPHYTVIGVVEFNWSFGG